MLFWNPLLGFFILAYNFWSRAAARLTLDPPASVAAVAEGSPYKVACHGSASVTWTLPSGSSSRNRELDWSAQGVAMSDAGNYQCSDSSEVINFRLLVFTVATESVNYKYRQEATLRCTVQDPRPFTYTWRLGNLNVDQVRSSFFEKSERFLQMKEFPNGTLRFIKPRRELAGLWTCLAVTEESGSNVTMVVNVSYNASPYVKPLDQPEGDDTVGGSLKLECIGLGYPLPNLSWWRDHGQLQSDGRYTVRQSDGRDTERQAGRVLSLKMSDLTWDDEGEYTCTATSDSYPKDKAEQSLVVRVKDGRTVYWALMAISGQLLTVLTIILVSEHKRKRAEAEEKKK